MKKRILLLIVLIVIACVMPGCGSDQIEKMFDKHISGAQDAIIENEASTELSLEVSAESESETEEETASVTEKALEPVQDVTNNPITTEEPAVPQWKTAYLDFLESRKNVHLSYALVYIDGDDIPELYLSGDCEATGDGVCSYKNGTVVEQRLGRIGGGSYIEKGGNFINQNGNMGCYYTDVYKLTENGFTQTFNALLIEHVVNLENGEYDLIYEYSIEGNPVNEDEYYAAVNAAFDFTRSVRLYENTVPYDVIKQQIADCK